MPNANYDYRHYISVYLLEKLISIWRIRASHTENLFDLFVHVPEGKTKKCHSNKLIENIVMQ